MRTKKQANNDRIKRLVAHRQNPAEPVDAATLLAAEATRLLRFNKLRPARKMAWAFQLAAAKLEAWGDPASLVRYQKVLP